MITWQWLAGFFDGEGTARIPLGTSRSISPTFQLTQSGKRGETILKKIEEFLHTYRINCTVYPNTRTPEDNAKYGIKSTLVNWRLGVYRREDVLFILKHILPFVHVKRPETQDIIRYCALYPSLAGNHLLIRESAYSRRKTPEQLEETKHNRCMKAKERYHNDPIYRNKMLRYRSEWKRRKRIIKSSLIA